MKKGRLLVTICGAALFALSVQGCVTTSRAMASVPVDDLYVPHNRQAIAQAQAERDAKKQAQENARIQRQEELLEQAYSLRNTGNPYNDLVSNSYAESYERRLRGFESPTYNMPSGSYSQYTALNYATAYDPAFYNVIVMGDEVWVEPKYVTAMFGSWGSPSRFSFNVGLGYPYMGWGSGYYPYNSWWGNSWGWGGYPLWGWNGNPYWGGGNPWWGWGGYPSWGWGGNPYWGGGHSSWGWGGRPSRFDSRNTVTNRPRQGSGTYYPSNQSGGGSTSIGNGNYGGSYRRPAATGTSVTPNTRPGTSTGTPTGTPAGTGNSTNSYRRGSSDNNSPNNTQRSTTTTPAATNDRYQRGSSYSTPSSSGSSESYSRGGSPSGSSSSGSSSSSGGGGGYSGGGSGGSRR